MNPLSRKAVLSALLASAIATPVAAQDSRIVPPSAAQTSDPVAEPPPADEEMLDGQEIVVTGQRPRGEVIGDIPPEIQLDERDIRAYGAGDLAELLEALSPQTSSGRGRGGGQPVVLLNGRRISGFSEIRGIPPEAIIRVDILPEEVALKYGYRADQRVVNFVLRERFRAVTAEVEYGAPTAGGRSSVEADVNVLRITDAGRVNLEAEYERDSALFESERDVIRAASGLPLIDDSTAGSADLSDFRTLLGESEELTLGATVSRTIFGDISATLNGRFGATSGRSRFGLPSGSLIVPADNPYGDPASDIPINGFVDNFGALTRDSDGRTYHLGLGLNGDLDVWRWSLTANYDRAANKTRTDTGVDLAAAQALLDADDPSFDPFGPLPDDLISLDPRSLSRSTNQSANVALVANAPILALPAGEVSATFRLGGETRGFDSETIRSGVEQSRSLSRQSGNAQASLDVPIASRRNDVLAAIGDLSANFNAEVETVSDFGTLRTIGYGVNWSPIDEISFIASVTDEDGAPSVQQLGDPQILTPNARVFDFVRGETVDITRLDGGNPALLADNRRVMKLGLTAKPLDETDLTLSVNYTNSRTRNPIASFPTATPEIEAAFPDRFQRDSGGRLLLIDNRPVNFARSDRQELRWGFNFSKPISSTPPTRVRPRRADGEARPGGEGAPTDAQRAERREARGQRGGGGRGGFGGRGAGQSGRLQLALYHNWRLEDSILIREGVPELDLLNGSAVGSRGGQSEHEVQLRAGIFKDGFGARLNGNWQSGTFVRGAADGAGASDGDLFFDDFATLDLRLFADLSQQASLVRDHPFFRGSRLTLSIDNIFDSRLSVRDATGATPISYQPAYLDPLGRTFRIGFRKLFF